LTGVMMMARRCPARPGPTRHLPSPPSPNGASRSLCGASPATATGRAPALRAGCLPRTSIQPGKAPRSGRATRRHNKAKESLPELVPHKRHPPHPGPQAITPARISTKPGPCRLTGPLRSGIRGPEIPPARQSKQICLPLSRQASRSRYRAEAVRLRAVIKGIGIIDHPPAPVVARRAVGQAVCSCIATLGVNIRFCRDEVLQVWWAWPRWPSPAVRPTMKPSGCLPRQPPRRRLRSAPKGPKVQADTSQRRGTGAG